MPEIFHEIQLEAALEACCFVVIRGRSITSSVLEVGCQISRSRTVTEGGARKYLLLSNSRPCGCWDKPP